MAGGNYNWSAAFVAFCNGTPEDEISAVFDIPLGSLKSKMGTDGWRGLRNKLPLVTLGGPAHNALAPAGNSGLPAEIEAKLQLIQDNREKNLEVFCDLRDKLIEKLQAWKAGNLKVEKVFNFKGAVIRAESDPGPGDWVNIATYAQTIAQGTYRALGDFQGQDKPGQDSPVGGVNTPQGPAITIILPGVVAMPRAERGMSDARVGQVIDVRPATTQKALEPGGAPQDPS